MSTAPLLASIAAPAVRPIFKRADLLAYPDDWLRANRVALEGWYLATGRCVTKSESPVSFRAFALAQLEIERAVIEAYRQASRRLAATAVVVLLASCARPALSEADILTRGGYTKPQLVRTWTTENGYTAKRFTAYDEEGRHQNVILLRDRDGGYSLIEGEVLLDKEGS